MGYENIPKKETEEEPDDSFLEEDLKNDYEGWKGLTQLKDDIVIRHNKLRQAMDESGSENIKDHAKLAEYKEEIAQLISQINILDDNLRANGIVLFFFDVISNIRNYCPWLAQPS